MPAAPLASSTPPPQPAANGPAPAPASSCLSQQPCQATAQRGPHDFAASWKVGTTDRSVKKVAAGGGGGGTKTKNGAPGAATAGGGAAAQQPQPQRQTIGSVANQMGISSGSVGSGNGGRIKKTTSLEQLSQLRIGGGESSKKKASVSGAAAAVLNKNKKAAAAAAAAAAAPAPGGGSVGSPALSAASAPPSGNHGMGHLNLLDGGHGGPASAQVQQGAAMTLPERPRTTSPPLSSVAAVAGANNTTSSRSTTAASASSAPLFQSQYQERLFNQPSDAVEAVLAASCDVMGFDIAEMWLRTGPKTHQLTNSHLRPTALEDSVRAELVDVYYGEMSSRRTHRLSPALCKRAKEAQDVVWVTANTERGAEALRCSISDVRTAVAVPVCHESSATNITLIYFSIRRAIMRPQAVEFLVHMSLSAAVASVNSLAEEVMVDVSPHRHVGAAHPHSASAPVGVGGGGGRADSSSSSLPLYHPHHHAGGGAAHGHPHHPAHLTPQQQQQAFGGLQQQQQQLLPGGAPGGPPKKGFSVTGACLDLKWNSLKNVEYLTDGGNNWIHTAVMGGRPVVVKTLKPECQDLALAINEIEGELEIHAQLDHPNIVGLVGAGTTSKGSRFVVLERLDGGTLTQHLGYDTRIRDRRRRFWKKKQFSYLEVLSCAKSLADSMAYCHGSAIPGSMVLHRDLKPDNVGFTLDGTVKLIDFGLARVVSDGSPESDDVYEMSGETGSLRYMAPEVADCRPYNHKADVYSFGTILWEIVAYKKPYDGMNREQFYDEVVHGGMRPPLSKKWPKELSQLISECWDVNYNIRPTFQEISDRLEALRVNEKGGGKKASARKRISALVDRHSTWF